MLPIGEHGGTLTVIRSSVRDSAGTIGGHNTGGVAGATGCGGWRPQLVSKPFGKRVVVNLQLGQLHILIGGNCNEGSVWETNHYLIGPICFIDNYLHCILVHCMEKNLR